MLLLDGTSDLVKVTVGTAADIEVHASYVENNAGTITPISDNIASITGTGANTVVPSPGASKQFNVKLLSIYNNHSSQATLITVSHTDGTDESVLWEGTLNASESVVFDQMGVWTMYDSSGNQKGTAFPAATQAEMEAASSTTVSVTPGRQHYHPGHPKCWSKNTANSTTILGSYNVASVADTNTGVVTITIATDFADTNWACKCSLEEATLTTVTDCTYSSLAAGTVILNSAVEAASGSDPSTWSFMGLGDHA